MPAYILYRNWRFSMGTYMATKKENIAWDYCVKNNIRIFPVCVENRKLWKVGINLGPYKKGEKPNLSPNNYGPGEIQKEIYKASTYYYNKYDKNTKTKR